MLSSCAYLSLEIPLSPGSSVSRVLSNQDINSRKCENDKGSDLSRFLCSPVVHMCSHRVLFSQGSTVLSSIKHAMGTWKLVLHTRLVWQGYCGNSSKRFFSVPQQNWETEALNEIGLHLGNWWNVWGIIKGQLNSSLGETCLVYMFWIKPSHLTLFFWLI